VIVTLRDPCNAVLDSAASILTITAPTTMRQRVII
jgi:hypothetical protein